MSAEPIQIPDADTMAVVLDLRADPETWGRIRLLRRLESAAVAAASERLHLDGLRLDSGDPAVDLACVDVAVDALQRARREEARAWDALRQAVAEHGMARARELAAREEGR